MSTLTPAGTTDATRIPGVYVWEPAGKTISIRLSLDVVDRLQQDIMRGFGAVPKRGAEVGGILLGRANSGEKTVVTIDDYEVVAIEYKRSPSYLLSEKDAGAFASAIDAARRGKNPLLRPIGYFRSHTREGTGLDDEDLALFRLHFPQPDAVALIVRPYASKVSQAGFYFKENGKFQEGPPLLEFPFRRRDLDPEAAPSAAGRRERTPGAPSMRRERAAALGLDAGGAGRGAASGAESQGGEAHESRAEADSPAAAVPSEAAAWEPTEAAVSSGRAAGDSRRRGVWMLLPLSFILLLLGVLAGFEAALSVRPQLPAGSNDPYSLNVVVSKSGANLQIKWNRQSLAIRNAQKGLLTIQDGNNTTPVPLNASDLQSGSVVYPPYSEHVTFRMDVTLNAKETLTETVQWPR